MPFAEGASTPRAISGFSAAPWRSKWALPSPSAWSACRAWVEYAPKRSLCAYDFHSITALSAVQPQGFHVSKRFFFSSQKNKKSRFKAQAPPLSPSTFPGMRKHKLIRKQEKRKLRHGIPRRPTSQKGNLGDRYHGEVLCYIYCPVHGWLFLHFLLSDWI